MTLHAFLSLDWRQPWQWPTSAQRAWWCVAGCVGMCAASPWWLARWQTWADAQALAEKITQQQDDTRRHQQRTADLQKQLTQATLSLAKLPSRVGQAEAVTRGLMASAHTHQLQVSHLSLEALQQPAALQALSLYQLPLHVQMQGAGKAWLNWWAQWPTWAPAATVSSLEVKVAAADAVVVQLKLLLPQGAAPLDQDWALAGGLHPTQGAPHHEGRHDPFSADDWARLQLNHAQQHPSFETWVASERQRVREPLEAFARERLRYVGWVSQGTGVQALVQVREDASGSSKTTPRLGDTVYRVGVGSYLGQDWGRVSTVTPEHVHLRELVRDPEGVWSARQVALPFEGVRP